MYRLWERGKEKGPVVEPLVLPRECREGVLRLAHTIPLQDTCSIIRLCRGSYRDSFGLI